MSSAGPGNARPSGAVSASLRAQLRDHLGPGLITGAADDDPSGIATYSQAGAQFGYSLLWTMVFMIHVPWVSVAGRSLFPTLALDRATLSMTVAVLGTTISPYLFFWQAAQEMEGGRLSGQSSDGILLRPEGLAEARRHLQRTKWDTAIGMGFSNLVAFFIMLSTAATLHAAGITDIQTSAQAAEALRPVGGEFTFLLFSVGIIGTGMLAVPVLAGSAAYAVAECFDWPSGLDMKLPQARGFYAIIAAATVGGVILDFTPSDPMKELFWSAIINGVIAVPIMAVMLVLAARGNVMGPFVMSGRLRRLGWLATGVMALAVLGMLISLR